MSVMSAQFADHPVAIPAELDAAWAWMEQQGYGDPAGDQPYLTAYPGNRVLGPVFRNGGGTGWFAEDSEAERRLRVIAQTGGDGTVAALWLDDDGRTRVVGLGSEGNAYVLADSALEFLRLAAVGYIEISEYTLGASPDNDEYLSEDVDLDAAYAPFREWLTTTYGVEVPEIWPAVDDDEFSTWVRAQLGEPEPEEPEAPGTGTTIRGGIQRVLAALRTKEGSPEIRAMADLFGVELTDGSLRLSARALKARRVEADVKRGKLVTVWIKLRQAGDQASAGMAATELVEGLPTSPTLADVTALLGEPEFRSEYRGVRYVVPEGWVHFQFNKQLVLEQVTVMADL